MATDWIGHNQTRLSSPSLALGLGAPKLELISTDTLRKQIVVGTVGGLGWGTFDV